MGEENLNTTTQTPKKQYGLFTSITMIVGIVIGSGIFFKSDDILVSTGGSIGLGVLVFCLAAISIIFGSLSIAELASRNDKAGGIITYAEDAWGKHVACAFGWFHTFLYYPTLTAVVAWVVGVYTTLLLGIEGTLINQILIGTATLTLLFVCNILSSKVGGYFQNLSTVIKLIPLFLIGFLGLTNQNPIEVDASTVENLGSAMWITAIGPIAFSFDGWIVATSIGHEIKNPKKNLPLALIAAPIFILAIYLLYFVGISTYMGPERIMQLGDEHVYIAASELLGSFGGKLVLIFVIISVMGTVNGLIMGLIRLPYSLAIRNMFPSSKTVSKLNTNLNISVPSALIGFVLTVFWMGVHYITMNNPTFLRGSNISDISITVNYLLYILLYVAVIRLGIKKEIKGVWRWLISPILATLGSLMILSAQIFQPIFWVFAVFCSVVLIVAGMFWEAQRKKNIE